MRKLAAIVLCWVFLKPTVRQLRQVLRLLALIDLYGGQVPDQRQISFREAVFTEEQWEWLLGLAQEAAVPHGQAQLKTRAVEALTNARITDLAPAKVDWSKLEAEAAKRGGDLVDLCFDKGRRKDRAA